MPSSKVSCYSAFMKMHPAHTGAPTAGSWQCPPLCESVLHMSHTCILTQKGCLLVSVCVCHVLCSLPASSLTLHNLGLESRSIRFALTVHQSVRAKALPPLSSTPCEAHKFKSVQEWNVAKVKWQLMFSPSLGTPGVND